MLQTRKAFPLNDTEDLTVRSIFPEDDETAFKQLEDGFVDSLVKHVLTYCRTPQELVAAQSDLMRDNVEAFVNSTRRIAEISMQMADQAARKMNDVPLAPR
jgi:hypothetical protein